MFFVVLSILIETRVSANSFTDQSLPSLSEIGSYVSSNRYTKLELNQVAKPVMEKFESGKTLQTELGEVYFDEESLAFQFFNQNGYLWSSTVDLETSDLSPNWKKRVQSAVLIESYNTNSPSFSTIEEYTLSDNTSVVTTMIENGFTSTITFGRSKITITIKVLFLQTGIEVEIPSDSIREDGTYKLANISVYPYFGAVLEDNTPGYIFVPDGVGALVRYQKANPSIISNYKKEYFGRNLSYNTEQNLYNFSEDGARLYAPVFGFVHGVNQNAMFANIISGANYANLNISYAGRINNYNTVYSQFVYRRTYLQPVDMAGNTIALYQTERNSYDIHVRFTPLEGNMANYVGMANVYRDYLDIDQKLNNSDSSNIPLKLDSIGLVKARGYLMNQSIIMTTLSEFASMIKDLNEEGIDNVIGMFSGYTKQGVNWSSPNYDNLSRKVGSKRDIVKLSQLVSTLYFEGEYQLASSRARGYSTYKDLAKKINHQHYSYTETDGTNYLLTHQKTKEKFLDSLDYLKTILVNGVASSMLGRLSYQDFQDGVNLVDAALIYQEMLTSQTLNVALADSNSYLWSSMDVFYQFPMYSSQYLQFSDTVPFIPITLHGALDLFASNANFYAYARDELLRLIDYGVYPSFLVTKESSKLLENTNLYSIYSSRFEDLKLSIIQYYNFVNGALKYVQNSQIIERKLLADGVVLTGYDNDIKIIVNYLPQAYTYELMSIAPKNYLVLKNNQIIMEKGGD